MSSSQHPLKVSFDQLGRAPARPARTVTTSALDGRVGGVLPPYRDHTGLTHNEGINPQSDRENSFLIRIGKWKFAKLCAEVACHLFLWCKARDGIIEAMTGRFWNLLCNQFLIKYYVMNQKF